MFTTARPERSWRSSGHGNLDTEKVLQKEPLMSWRPLVEGCSQSSWTTGRQLGISTLTSLASLPPSLCCWSSPVTELYRKPGCRKTYWYSPPRSASLAREQSGKWIEEANRCPMQVHTYIVLWTFSFFANLLEKWDCTMVFFCVFLFC